MIIVPSKKLKKYLAEPPDGGFGWVLQEGAPEDVKQEFKKFKDIIRAHHAEQYPDEYKELKWLHDE